MMDFDPRFPNRKKKTEEPSSSLGYDLPEEEPLDIYAAEADLYAPSAYQGMTEPEPEPEPEPEVPVAAAPNPAVPEFDGVVADTNWHYSFDEVMEAEKQKQAAEHRPDSPRRPEANRTRFYLTVGLGLGILFGVVVAAVSWLTGNPDGRYDLGSVTSSGTGLKGHLFTKWDNKLEYRLTLEASEPAQQAGFAFAVATSPRPLSVEVHLQDSQGFVLCTREVVLKYDARNAEALGAAPADARSAKTAAGNVVADPSTQGMDALVAAQEASRELGKDVFQDQIGPDGHVQSIRAEGVLPCAKDAYERATSWTFVPDYPSLAEQEDWLKIQKEGLAGAAASSATRKKSAKKPAPKLLPFSIEGDDAIVEFDTSRGTVETRGGRFFFFDKTGGAGSDSRWQDYPASVHYKCDQALECILTHSGAGALRARLRQ